MNKRILVIDDEESIRDSFELILNPPNQSSGSLMDAASDLFGEQGALEGSRNSLLPFEVTVASSGEKGLHAVQRSVEQGEPFAAIFCDMRMPGMDGLDTVEAIRKIDTRAEVIFVTAFSDHSIDEVVMRSGPNVSYFCKPFAPEEIRQLATKAVHDWEKARNLEGLIQVVTHLQGNLGDLHQLLRNILQQVTNMLQAESSMIVRSLPDGKREWVMGIGNLNSPNLSGCCIEGYVPAKGTPFQMHRGCAVFQMAEFHVCVQCDGPGGSLSLEKGYLVTLFLDQAAQILRNQELEQALIHKEQLSAVGQAISMAAHDLRSPVASIRSAVELARLDEVPENLETIFDLITRCTDMSMELINDILDFVRDSPFKTRQVQLDEMLTSLQELSEPILDGLGFRLEIESPPDLMLEADASKIVRVLYNLIKNASEALQTVSREERCSVIRLVIAPEEESLVFEVIDQGPGIPEEMMSGLFKPFSTHGKSQGTGLGLAIAKRIVERHQGQMEVESGPGGTTFRFSLPVAGVSAPSS